MLISKSKLLFFLTSILLLTACNKGKKVSPADTSAQYYIIGAVNNKTFNWEVDNKIWGNGYGMTVSTDQGIGVGELQATISADTTTHHWPSIGIGFGTYQVGTNQSAAALTTYFNGFINTGAWNYATSNVLVNGAKEITIYYTDADGNNYSSAGLQTAGSVVSVTSVKQITYASGIKAWLDITVAFSSCTLYNLNGYSSSITLSDVQAHIHLPNLLY